MISVHQLVECRRLAAAHTAFGAIALRVAGRASVLEEQRSSFPAEAEHLVGHRADLPLRSRAAAQGEEVPELTDVHRHDEARLAGIREHHTRVFLRYAEGDELIVEALDVRHQRLVADAVDVVRRDGRGNDILEAVLRTIALTSHAERSNAASCELCQEGAADTLDAEREARVLEWALMT